jgi:hypothetical protein
MGHSVSQPTRLMSSTLPADIARTVFDALSPYTGCLQLFTDGYSVRSEAAAIWSREHMQKSFSTELRQKLDARFVVVPDIAAYFEQHTDCVEKFCLFFESMEDKKLAWDALNQIAGIEVVQGAPDNLEVTAAGVDKGEALLALGANLGIAREDILAVGDSENDFAMLQKAGIAAVMANGMPHIKEIADIVTKNDNNHDGVAELLECIFV